MNRFRIGNATFDPDAGRLLHDAVADYEPEVESDTFLSAQANAASQAARQLSQQANAAVISNHPEIRDRDYLQNYTVPPLGLYRGLAANHVKTAEDHMRVAKHLHGVSHRVGPLTAGLLKSAAKQHVAAAHMHLTVDDVKQHRFETGIDNPHELTKAAVEATQRVRPRLAGAIARVFSLLQRPDYPAKASLHRNHAHALEQWASNSTMHESDGDRQALLHAAGLHRKAAEVHERSYPPEQRVKLARKGKYSIPVGELASLAASAIDNPHDITPIQMLADYMNENHADHPITAPFSAWAHEGTHAGEIAKVLKESGNTFRTHAGSETVPWNMRQNTGELKSPLGFQRNPGETEWTPTRYNHHYVPDAGDSYGWLRVNGDRTVTPLRNKKLSSGEALQHVLNHHGLPAVVEAVMAHRHFRDRKDGEDRPTSAEKIQLARHLAFISPSTKEDSTVDDAMNDRLGRDLLKRESLVPGVGFWKDGAEASGMLTGDDESELIQRAAELGKRWRQKAVVAFLQDKKGPDRSHIIRTAEADPVALHKALTKAGVEFKTIQPHAYGSVIHVLDEGGKLEPSLRKWAGETGAKVRTSPGHVRFIGADDRDSAQHVFDEAIGNERALRLARKQAHRIDNTAAATQTAQSVNTDKRKVIVEQIIKEAGLSPAAVRSVLAHEPGKGVRSTVLTAIKQQLDPRMSKYVAAWIGMLGREKAVTVFHPHTSGKDRLHVFKSTLPPDQLGQFMQDSGVPKFYVEDTGGGSRGYVFSPGGQYDQHVQRVVGGTNASHATYTGTGFRIGSGEGTDADARENYRNAIRSFESHATSGSDSTGPTS